MDKRTEMIKQLIDRGWKSRRSFAEHAGIPASTLTSMLERGIGNASVDNVLKVCAGLGISTDELLRLSEENSSTTSNPSSIQTIAAHIDEDVTESEIEDIKKYIEFIKSQRKN